MANNKMKIVGALATIVGLAATFISDWANECEIEELIDEKIKEALGQNKEEEES